MVENDCRKPGTNFIPIFSDSFQKNLKKFMAVEVFHFTKQYYYPKRKESRETRQNKRTYSEKNVCHGNPVCHRWKSLSLLLEF